MASWSTSAGCGPSESRVARQETSSSQRCVSTSFHLYNPLAHGLIHPNSIAQRGQVTNPSAFTWKPGSQRRHGPESRARNESTAVDKQEEEKDQRDEKPLPQALLGCRATRSEDLPKAKAKEVQPLVGFGFLDSQVRSDASTEVEERSRAVRVS